MKWGKSPFPLDIKRRFKVGSLEIVDTTVILAIFQTGKRTIQRNGAANIRIKVVILATVGGTTAEYIINLITHIHNHVAALHEGFHGVAACGVVIDGISPPIDVFVASFLANPLEERIQVIVLTNGFLLELHCALPNLIGEISIHLIHTYTSFLFLLEQLDNNIICGKTQDLFLYV